ncbi:MAG: hypothetical protein JNM90_02225, partial [Burkholderiales bacterium]|nr:hypothetical protein [Burkholderiales bacterium]
YDVTYDDAQLPASLWSVHFESGGTTSLTMTESAPIVQLAVGEYLRIAPIGTTPVPVWQQRVDLTINPRVPIIYQFEATNLPYVVVDDGVVYRQPTEHWTVSITVEGRAPIGVQSAGVNSAPDFTSFATAVGHNALAATLRPLSGSASESTSATTQFLSPLSAGNGQLVGFQSDWPAGPWQVSFDHLVHAPTYAAPSTTVPQCRSLDCMDFVDGRYRHDYYDILLYAAVTETRFVMTPVPEPRAWAALLAGLAMLGAMVGRRGLIGGLPHSGRRMASGRTADGRRDAAPATATPPVPPALTAPSRRSRSRRP